MVAIKLLRDFILSLSFSLSLSLSLSPSPSLLAFAYYDKEGNWFLEAWQDKELVL